MKRVFFGAALASMLVASGASAAPKKAAEPALPAPAVKLVLTAGPGGAPWRIQIVNEGQVPVRIPADARLLGLELTPTTDGKKKPIVVKCTLPDDSRPASDEGNELVVPPTKSWSATFDPLFYCFGPKERAALAAGTSVRARFGWTTAGTQPPYAVAPVGAGVGKVANVRSLDAEPVTLAEAVPLAPSTMPEDTGENPVSLIVPETMDASRGIDLGTTVTLVNGDGRALTVLYRPEMLLFRVVGPAGGVACGFTRQVLSPIRELYGTVPAHGKTSVGVLFDVTCPAGTFDEPGLYRVTPKLDLTGASGRAIGLKSWDGTAIARKPLVVRVRNPRRPALPPKPALD